MTTQKQEAITLVDKLDEITRRPFIEPEISDPVEILETTAFFQGISGGTDSTGDLF